MKPQHDWQSTARSEGWLSPEEVAELRSALIECDRQTESMRVWGGMQWHYHPPQAKRIHDIARAAIGAAREKQDG